MTTTVVGTGATGQYGKPYRSVQNDRDEIVITDFDISRFGKGLVYIEAVLGRLEIGNGKADTFYRLVGMNGQGRLDSFHIYDVTATNLNRGGLRFTHASNGLVERVHVSADSVGCEDIPCGFAANDGNIHDVTYRDCTATGFKQIGGGSYPNGDGFSDEETHYNMVYENCEAYDNTDSGFDIKSIDSRLTNCTAQGSRRNFRGHFTGVWTDCTSIDPTQAHFQFASNRVLDYTLIRPEFIGGSDKAHLRLEYGEPGSRIVLVDPILPGGEELRIARVPGEGGNIEVVVVHTTFERPAQLVRPYPDTDPRTVQATTELDGVTYSGTLTEI